MLTLLSLLLQPTTVYYKKQRSLILKSKMNFRPMIYDLSTVSSRICDDILDVTGIVMVILILDKQQFNVNEKIKEIVRVL